MPNDACEFAPRLEESTCLRALKITLALPTVFDFADLLLDKGLHRPVADALADQMAKVADDGLVPGCVHHLGETDAVKRLPSFKAQYSVLPLEPKNFTFVIGEGGYFTSCDIQILFRRPDWQNI